jgi:uncharacterized protein YjbI with pentapeptide repeats
MLEDLRGFHMVARVRFVLLTVAVLATQCQPLRAENLDHVKLLRETGKCSGCDLSSAKLAGLISPEADLRNADLNYAVLYKVRLNKANLDGATLKGANLEGADLTGASLTGADLSGANLRGSIGARLAKASTDVTTTCPDGANGPCVAK